MTLLLSLLLAGSELSAPGCAVVHSVEGQVCYLRCSGNQTMSGSLTLTGQLNAPSIYTGYLQATALDAGTGRVANLLATNLLATYAETPGLDAGVGRVAFLRSTEATIGFLDAGITWIHGLTKVTADVQPEVNSTVNLGSSALRYATVWSFNVGAASTCKIDFNPNAIDVTATGDLNILSGSNLDVRSRIELTDSVWESTTAPTLTGFGTSPSVVWSNGTATFRIDVGGGGTATNGTITFPAATNGWICKCSNLTNPNAGGAVIEQSGISTTTCAIGNYVAGVLTAWAANDNLLCHAGGG